jgi:peptidyl-prolyl cis-trans isomerase C
MIPSRYVPLAFGLAFGLACPVQGQETPVASVAGHPITAGELLFQEARFPGGGQHRRQLLDLLISREVLRAEGRGRGMDQSPEIAGDLAQLERKLLLEEIEARESLNQAPPIAEEALAALYEQWGAGEEVRPRQILVESQDQARDLIAQLQQGASFAELAKRDSMHRLSGLGGGDMGYLRRDMLLPEFREQVWAMGAGQLCPEPLQSRLGFHVVQMQERRKLPLETMRPALVAELEQRHQDERRSALGRRLREEFGFRWNAEAAQALIGRERPAATAADSSTLVAQWEGGQLSAAAYLKRLRPFGVKQSLADSALARERGEQVVVEDLLLAEARRRQYQREPALRRRLEVREAELLADRLFALEVGPQAAVSDSALRSLYELRPDQYRLSPAAEVQEILAADQATADSLKAMILAGADMGQLARQHSTRAWAREKEGMLGVLSRDSAGYGPLLPLALEAPVDSLQGPVLLGGEYSLFRVVRRIPDRPASFEEAKELVKKQWLDRQMDRFIAELHLRYADQIQIDEQALEALPAAGR